MHVEAACNLSPSLAMHIKSNLKALFGHSKQILT